MSKFNSLSRKLTLLLLPLFMVGWAFYVAGFVSELNAKTTFIGASQSISILCPYYIVLVGGPFIIKLGLLHAVMSDVASSVCGAILSMLSTAYFTSVGATMFTCTAIITKGIPKSDLDLDNPHYVNLANIKLTLMGLLLQGFSWLVVLVLSTFYDYKLEQQRKDSSSECTFTPKVAQNANIVCLVLTMVGWCVLCVGLYHTSNNWLHVVNAKYPSFYTSQWRPFFMSSTLILMNMAVLLQVGSTNTKVTICIAVLNLMYLYLLGDKVNSTLIKLHECNDSYYFCSQEYKYALRLVLGGGVVSIFFWGCSFALWPFYRTHLPSNRVWWKCATRML